MFGCHFMSNVNSYAKPGASQWFKPLQILNQCVIGLDHCGSCNKSQIGIHCGFRQEVWLNVCLHVFFHHCTPVSLSISLTLTLPSSSCFISYCFSFNLRQPDWHVKRHVPCVWVGTATPHRCSEKAADYFSLARINTSSFATTQQIPLSQYRAKSQKILLSSGTKKRSPLG